MLEIFFVKLEVVKEMRQLYKWPLLMPLDILLAVCDDD
jgi:hypothetical protein